MPKHLFFCVTANTMTIQTLAFQYSKYPPLSIVFFSSLFFNFLLCLFLTPHPLPHRSYILNHSLSFCSNILPASPSLLFLSSLFPVIFPVLLLQEGRVRVGGGGARLRCYVPPPTGPLQSQHCGGDGRRLLHPKWPRPFLHPSAGQETNSFTDLLSILYAL